MSTTGEISKIATVAPAQPNIQLRRPLATVLDVASWLRTSPKAVYAMVERGNLPGVVRVGRRILFDETELILWVAERRP